MHGSRRTVTFCPLPWIHIATRPNGDVRLCCTSNASGAGEVDEKTIGLVKKGETNLNLRDNTIEEIWNSDFMKQTRLQMLKGEIPSSCRKCFVEESNGIISKRQWETEVWNNRLDLDQIIKTTNEDGSLPLHIPYFDLRLGNMCQLKCVMCSPHDSSSWIKDWKLQYPLYQNLDLKIDQRWDNQYDYSWYRKGSFLDSMKDQAKNIRELYFAGGEPLLIPEHYKILEFMIDSGNAANCVLRYNSNGVELPDKLFQLWNHFKSVKFNFSIDDIGQRNDYIRFPSKWKNIVSNLKKLDETSDNVSVNVACAVQLLNVLTITDLARWKLDQKFKKVNLTDGAGIIGTHLVYFPSYLNIRVLPENLKKLAEEKIMRFINEQNTNEVFVNHPMGRRRWLGIINYMMQEDWSSKIPMLKEYLEICDQTRGTDFKKVFPEIGSSL
jgi:MoaA/NifB/PqqE/SkfB family radical SAM enzyme